jgi:hypothetical protein
MDIDDIEVILDDPESEDPETEIEVSLGLATNNLNRVSERDVQDLDGLEKGDQAVYKSRENVDILRKHPNGDAGWYYTCRKADGSEVQTLRKHLVKIEVPLKLAQFEYHGEKTEDVEKIRKMISTSYPDRYAAAERQIAIACLLAMHSAHVMQPARRADAQSCSLRDTWIEKNEKKLVARTYVGCRARIGCCAPGSIRIPYQYVEDTFSRGRG